MTKRLIAAGLALLALAACGKTGDGGDPNDAYSGLDSQILAWRTAIEASHPSCADKIDGKGCTDFQVACKAAQVLTPDDTAKGVSARIVAAMTFNGRAADGVSGRPGSAFASFSKAGGRWSRGVSPPVNLKSCSAA